MTIRSTALARVVAATAAVLSLAAASLAAAAVMSARSEGAAQAGSYWRAFVASDAAEADTQA